MAVYIHERIDIEGGARGRMIELIRNRWAPHLEQRYGVRLFGAWATVGSTGAWPEVRLHWEMDDWAQFARAQAGQFPMEERDVFLTELWNLALDYRLHGSSALLRATSFSPDLARVRAEGNEGELILHEDVRARPGRLDAYHAALEARFMPLAAKHGVRLLGAYAHALVPNLGINLWALRSWDHWREWGESEARDSERLAWTAGLGEWLEDLDGFLVARPPQAALRT